MDLGAYAIVGGGSSMQLQSAAMMHGLCLCSGVRYGPHHTTSYDGVDFGNRNRSKQMEIEPNKLKSVRTKNGDRTE